MATKVAELKTYGLDTFRANLEADLAKLNQIIDNLQTLALAAEKPAEQISALRAAGQILLSKPDAYLDRIHRVGPPPKEIIQLNKDVAVQINDTPTENTRPPQDGESQAGSGGVDPESESPPAG